MKTKDPGGQQSSGVPDCCTNHILPTGNLDSKTSNEVIELLRITSQKFHQTIVMITHNPEIAKQADRCIRIEDGKVASAQEGRADV